MKETITREKSAHYSVSKAPLTEEDKRKIKKGSVIATTAWILIGLFFTWAATANVSYWFVLLICSVLCFIIPLHHFRSIRKSMANNKIIFTGTVTKKIKGEEVLVYFGPEAFDITYAENVSQIETGDVVALHYAQGGQGERGLLLNVEKLQLVSIPQENL